MSDVELAYKYAAENYPIALENLAKRYQRSDGSEPVHYSELGFGGISDEQAKYALRFFADIELFENPKGANYIPSESLINWQLKLGDSAQKGKEGVRQKLLEYEVFDELTFVLEEGEQQIEALAEQVGGMVGIDEDELPEMVKTIEVFAACGFFEIDGEGVVSLPEGERENHDEGEPSEEKTQESTRDEEVQKTSNPEADDAEAIDTVNSPPPQPRKAIEVDLEISINATEMDADDFREKLEILEDVTGYDGE